MERAKLRSGIRAYLLTASQRKTLQAYPDGALAWDESSMRRMLEIWPVCSPHARARILRRDATQARQMPGIARVLFAEDVPGANQVGPVRHDEPLLATDEVYYQGQNTSRCRRY
jgi:xanthine dehydrogenase molybdopterin-binding subunit B